MERDKKINRCRYSFPDFTKDGNIIHKCIVNGWEDENVKTCTEEQCEMCEKFDSRYIEYPLTINGIEDTKIDTSGSYDCGSLVEIKPCGEEYKGKSYIGIYLGELPIQITTYFDRNTKILKNSTRNNPAIFVPELKKIIYGCESWWRVIESVDDFKEIPKEDIDNTWYVQLLKGISKAEE